MNEEQVPTHWLSTMNLIFWQINAGAEEFSEKLCTIQQIDEIDNWQNPKQILTHTNESE